MKRRLNLRHEVIREHVEAAVEDWKVNHFESEKLE